jgi:hypothetical protein
MILEEEVPVLLRLRRLAVQIPELAEEQKPRGRQPR